MSLKSGTHLGPYEILSQIGAGGMGEVYKARDTRLNRIVAIKVLPAHLAEQPDLRERFKREAETIGVAQHLFERQRETPQRSCRTATTSRGKRFFLRLSHRTASSGSAAVPQGDRL